MKPTTQPATQKEDAMPRMLCQVDGRSYDIPERWIIGFLTTRCQGRIAELGDYMAAVNHWAHQDKLATQWQAEHKS